MTSPTIWLKFDSATSPAYHCQLVLVAKLIAVLNAPSAPIPSSPRGFIGKTPCKRSTA